jgi:tetratricopeptide (TPR) repeat protein
LALLKATQRKFGEAAKLLRQALERNPKSAEAHNHLGWVLQALTQYESAVLRPVRTASATQVRRPIYRDSITRWRPYRAMLQPLLEALGAGPTSDPDEG